MAQPAYPRTENYTKSNPAVPYSCFKHEGVSPETPNGDKTKPLLVDKSGNLTPCDINEGDNAWMLAA
jgi:hypothetical protein